MADFVGGSPALGIAAIGKAGEGRPAGQVGPESAEVDHHAVLSVGIILERHAQQPRLFGPACIAERRAAQRCHPDIEVTLWIPTGYGLDVTVEIGGRPRSPPAVVAVDAWLGQAVAQCVEFGQSELDAHIGGYALEHGRGEQAVGIEAAVIAVEHRYLGSHLRSGQIGPAAHVFSIMDQVDDHWHDQHGLGATAVFAGQIADSALEPTLKRGSLAVRRRTASLLGHGNLPYAQPSIEPNCQKHP